MLLWRMAFEDTDLCVKCGLCLSGCPTYQLYHSESDSPRGRISLMQALHNGQLSADDETLRLHLDRCLGCGHCESACPSGVPYLQLLDQTRSRLGHPTIKRWQLDLLASPDKLAVAASLRRLLPEMLSQKTASALGFPDLPELPTRFRPADLPVLPDSPDTSGGQRGRVALFTGCVGQFVDAAAITTIGKCLAQLGFEVVVPSQQVCCGAMHQHEGYLQPAQQKALQNQRVFCGDDFDAVIYFASACGSQLLREIPGFTGPLVDAAEFLAGLPEFIDMTAAGTGRVALHRPCSMKTGDSAWRKTLALLDRLLAERLVELPENHLCCGSGGLHQIKFPQAAMQLLQPKLEAVGQIMPDVILTANTGCHLHLHAGLKHSALSIPVKHPAQWLCEQFLSAQKFGQSA